MFHPVFSSSEKWPGRMPFGERRGRIYRTAALLSQIREARAYRARLRAGGETAQARCSGRGDRSLTGPLSLLLWSLLSCNFFLKVGVAQALSRRTVTTARSPALIVPSVDGFHVILWFACAVRHVENIISVSDPRHLCVPKIRSCNIGDEGRQGRVGT
jgi:hypothetical protein